MVIERNLCESFGLKIFSLSNVEMFLIFSVKNLNIFSQRFLPPRGIYIF